MVLGIDHDITRNFEFDYLIFDALFLALYVFFLIRTKRYAALKAGLVCGGLFYLIDGVIWVKTGVREYGLSAPWIKHPTDFMMDVSYGIVAFSWVWIAFERRGVRDIAIWAAALFSGWLAVPAISRLIPLVDDPVMTVRHMAGQVWLQIVVVLAGYVMLIWLRYDLKTILYVFAVGCLLSFMMEFSLLMTRVRPQSVRVLLYETLVLTNQGVPYFFVIRDKIAPWGSKGLAARRTARTT